MVTTSPDRHAGPQSRLRFVFIRHGVATDVEGRCIGHTDVSLSAEGALAIRDLQFDVAPHRIISSDLARAYESARIIGASTGVFVETDSRLREMNFGVWDGQHWSDLERNDGKRLSQWMDHWITAAPPNGETVDALAHRVAWWLDEQLANDSLHGSTTLVVAHAGSIRAALCVLTGVPLEKMFDINVEHARATVLELSGTGWKIAASNVRVVA